MGMPRDEFDRLKARAAAAAKGAPPAKSKRPPRVRGVAPKEERMADGIVFASKRERDRYLELVRLRKAGAVRWFIRQVPFHLPGGVRYVADFLVVWRTGMVEVMSGKEIPRIVTVTVEDVKGHRTDVYKLKKRQVEEIYGIEIQEV